MVVEVGEVFKKFKAIEKTLIEHTKILEKHSKKLNEMGGMLREHGRRRGAG